MSEPTVAEALRRHYQASGLPADGGRCASRWTLELGPLRLTLGNFAWRRRALPCHDLHHLLTGYRCTPAGEFEMAAWEFAAGRFPSLCATLFCLPLVGLGALLTPRRSFAAFARGRRSRTLYMRALSAEILAMSVPELRRRHVAADGSPATAGDCARYLALCAASWLLIAAPLLALALAS